MKKWIVIAVAGILILGGIIGGIYYKKNNEQKKSEDNVQQDETSKIIEYDGANGMSALDLLLQLADVKYQNSEYGAYITSINGITNTENEYWLYSVNGEEPMVSADKYTTKDGDKIKWEFKGM